MGAGVWAAVIISLVIVLAGAIAWWLANGCHLTRVGAAGALVGGVASLITLAALLDPDAALRASGIITVVSGAWLLGWALAGGIRGQRLLEREEREASAVADARLAHR